MAAKDLVLVYLEYEKQTLLLKYINIWNHPFGSWPELAGSNFQRETCAIDPGQMFKYHELFWLLSGYKTTVAHNYTN